MQVKCLRKELLDSKVAEYGGRIIKTTGNGVLVEFPSAVNGVQHAVEIQRAMAPHDSAVPQDRRLEMRIGINVGDSIWRVKAARFYRAVRKPLRQAP